MRMESIAILFSTGEGTWTFLNNFYVLLAVFIVFIVDFF